MYSRYRRERERERETPPTACPQGTYWLYYGWDIRLKPKRNISV